MRLTPPLASLALALLPTPDAPAGTVTLALEPVALEGDPAPGFPAGARFAAFTVNPAFVTTPPRIDRGGVIAFLGLVEGAGTTSAGLPTGLYRDTAAGLELVVADGDPAPGTTTTFDGPYLGSFPGGAVVDESAVTFSGFLDASTAGVWSDVPGPLSLVALKGQSPPGIPSGATLTAGIGFLVRDDVVLFTNQFGASNQAGIWRVEGGVTTPVQVTGLPAPGFAPGVTFGADQSFLKQLDDVALDASGRTAFDAFVSGPGVTSNEDEAIWVTDPTGGPALFLREGDPAPGEPPGTVFGNSTGFDVLHRASHPPLRMNDLGRIAFGADLFHPAQGSVMTVWSDRSGTLERIVSGTSGGAGAPPGDRPPGFSASATFVGFSNLLLNDANEVALQAVVHDGPDIFTDNFTTVYVDRAGELSLVARAGGPVPGVPGASFSSVSALGFHPSGHLFLGGSWVEGGATLVDGLFLVEPDDDVVALVREGDVVDVAGDGSDLRTVETLDVGEGSAADLTRAVRLAFTDGTEGVFRARLSGAPVQLVPTPSTVSVTAGGTVSLRLVAGLENAGRGYVLLASATGTSPGVPLPGGDVLPLVPDVLLDAVLSNLNGPVFQSFAGALDPVGLGEATLDTLGPVPAALIGQSIHFAYVLGDPLDFASNAATITFVP